MSNSSNVHLWADVSVLPSRTYACKRDLTYWCHVLLAVTGPVCLHHKNGEMMAAALMLH